MVIGFGGGKNRGVARVRGTQHHCGTPAGYADLADLAIDEGDDFPGSRTAIRIIIPRRCPPRMRMRLYVGQA